MTTAVSSVSSSTPATSTPTAAPSALSDDTKKKLQALGLDPTKYATEADAEQAIQDATAKQAATKKPDGAGNFKTIEEEAQALASEMGIPVGQNDKMSDIMDAITAKIDDLQSSAGSDPTKLAQVNDYNSKFSSISSELAQLQASRSMTGATALGNYNKASQGLAA